MERANDHGPGRLSARIRLAAVLLAGLVAVVVLVAWLVGEVAAGNLLALLWLTPFPVAAWLVWQSHLDARDDAPDHTTNDDQREDGPR